MNYLQPLQVLWDYLGMHQAPEEADCIVGFGNFNTNIARRAAQLYLQGYAPLQPLQVLWDYLGMHQAPEEADCIVGFGNFNTNIARRAAQLYLQGYAPRILFTGGLGRNTKRLMQEPEAVIFARTAMECGVARRAAQLYLQGYAPRILFTGGLGRNTKRLMQEPEAVIFARTAMECGVPEEAILLEDRSTNTAENILFTRAMLEEQGIPHGRILGVHQPFMERRICAAMPHPGRAPALYGAADLRRHGRVLAGAKLPGHVATGERGALSGGCPGPGYGGKSWACTGRSKASGSRRHR